VPEKRERTKTGAVRKVRSLGSALVVEDDALVAMDIAEALEHAGARSVLTVPSVAEAMAELETHIPDIMILDVHLADRDDGWALAELATQLAEARPLILFTTAAPATIPASVASLGHVLPKPFRAQDLVALVHRERQPGLLGRIRNVLSGN
jgi:CheY-like chemotaxis protein